MSFDPLLIGQIFELYDFLLLAVDEKLGGPIFDEEEVAFLVSSLSALVDGDFLIRLHGLSGLFFGFFILLLHLLSSYFSLGQLTFELFLLFDFPFIDLFKFIDLRSQGLMDG